MFKEVLMSSSKKKTEEMQDLYQSLTYRYISLLHSVFVNCKPKLVQQILAAEDYSMKEFYERKN